MAFRSFRYHPDADEGLEALFKRGKTTFEDLMRLIQRVQTEWQPQEESVPEYLVDFEDFFLIFTVGRDDPSVLVLAAVERQPSL
jgi:hypothetical protein